MKSYYAAVEAAVSSLFPVKVFGNVLCVLRVYYTYGVHTYKTRQFLETMTTHTNEKQLRFQLNVN